MKKIIVICGATASGKTRLAADLALYLGTEVISADSMQVYRRMDIGTAKPTVSEMRGVTHHLIDIREPDERFDLSQFTHLAGEAAESIALKGRIPIMAGGTGLYIDTFIGNFSLSEMTPLPGYRAELEALAKAQGNALLLEMLRKVDPDSAERLHVNDLRRIIRALEVYRSTGVPQSRHIEQSQRSPKLYDPLYLGLSFSDRALLYGRIDSRVDGMIDSGLVYEVEGLLKEGVSSDYTSMQAIGYKEMCRHIRGECSLDEASEEIKSASRKYAKRQLTWLRRNKSINWFDVDSGDYSGLLDYCKKLIDIKQKESI